MIESGELAFGRGNPGGSRAEGTGGGSGGGLPGGGAGRGAGGGPGGLPGGSPDGMSEDDIATRQAEFAEGGSVAFKDRFLTGAVVRMLQTKTGEAPERARIFDAVVLEN